MDRSPYLSTGFKVKHSFAVWLYDLYNNMSQCELLKKHISRKDLKL